VLNEAPRSWYHCLVPQDGHACDADYSPHFREHADDRGSAPGSTACPASIPIADGCCLSWPRGIGDGREHEGLVAVRVDRHDRTHVLTDPPDGRAEPRLFKSALLGLLMLALTAEASRREPTRSVMS